jgi:adenosylcobinamide-GDP ribazoletransferase
VAAVLAIAVGLLLTGGFHEDAASDAADGLGGGYDRDRVLAIMKDSRLGAYGAMALWVVLSLRWAVLMAFAQSGIAVVCAFALAGTWGRWTAAPLLRLPALGSAGLSKDMSKNTGIWPFIIATFFALVVSGGLWWWNLDRAPWAAIAAVIATVIWAGYLKRRLGGQSGDLLGAGNIIAEAAVLVTLCCC